MAIGLEWQNEDGQVVAGYHGPPIGAWLPNSAPMDSVCLRFIDPWGDTTFNQLQVPILLKELEGLATNSTVRELRENVAAVAGFVRQGLGQVHTYLKFIGD